MSSASDKTLIRARAIPGTLRFTDWPLRDDPLRSGLLLILLIGVSWFAAHSAQDPAVGALAFALAALTLRRLWIPTLYELGSKGIVLSRFGRKRRIPWSEIARVEFHDSGLYCCPDPDRHPLSFVRGLFIAWNGRRDEIQIVVDYYLQPPPALGSQPTTRSLTQV